MNDFLTRLLARSLGENGTILPRVPSRYEGAAEPAVFEQAASATEEYSGGREKGEGRRERGEGGRERREERSRRIPAEGTFVVDSGPGEAVQPVQGKRVEEVLPAVHPTIREAHREVVPRRPVKGGAQEGGAGLERSPEDLLQPSHEAPRPVRQQAEASGPIVAGVPAMVPSPPAVSPVAHSERVSQEGRPQRNERVEGERKEGKPIDTQRSTPQEKSPGHPMVTALPSLQPPPLPAGEAAQPTVPGHRQANTASSPVIQISIGRIEVRAAPKQAQAAPKQAPAAPRTEQRPVLSLDEYLKQRGNER